MLRVLAICCMYLVVGPTLILLNKTIMRDYFFPYPTTLSAMGVMTSALVTHAAVKLGYAEVTEENRAAVAGDAFWRKLAPVGALFAITLSSGNAVYLFLDVGFVQILKAFTPVTLMAVLYAAKVESPSVRLMQSVVIISVGTLITTVTAVKVSMSGLVPGLVLALLAEVSEALRLVLTQSLLVNSNFSVVEGQYFLAPVSSLGLLALALFLDLPRALKGSAADVADGADTGEEDAAAAADQPGLGELVPLLLCASVLGVVVNYMGYFVIREGGSLTLKVLGTLRGIGLVVYSVLVLGDSLAPLEFVGYGTSLVGFLAYTVLRHEEGGFKEGSAQAKHHAAEGAEQARVEAAAAAAKARQGGAKGPGYRVELDAELAALLGPDDDEDDEDDGEKRKGGGTGGANNGGRGWDEPAGLGTAPHTGGGKGEGKGEGKGKSQGGGGPGEDEAALADFAPEGARDHALSWEEESDDE